MSGRKTSEAAPRLADFYLFIRGRVSVLGFPPSTGISWDARFILRRGHFACFPLKFLRSYRVDVHSPKRKTKTKINRIRKVAECCHALRKMSDFGFIFTF